MNLPAGGITIYNSEYRPCIVGDKNALFHRWIEKERVILKFNYPTKPWVMSLIRERFERDNVAPVESNLCTVKNTFGLVEFEDGTIHEVDPKEIRFLDSRNVFHENGVSAFKKGKDDKENET
jgi:hypothetical protein